MKIITQVAGVTVMGLMMLTGNSWANNLIVTNAAVMPGTVSTAKVKFDISWEHSWRLTNVNHDAAWVFFKVQKEGDVSNNWQSVKLEGTGINPPGYLAGTGTGIELIVPDDRVGLFVRRAAEGTGSVSVQNVQANWQLAANGLTVSNRVRLQVFAVEMVYVAAGPLTVGSGGTEVGSFTAGLWTNGITVPYQITNEAELLITNAAGYLWGTGGGNSSVGSAGPLSQDFPKGYAAFYCMKYEISQGQYCDFLNALTRNQQSTRVASLVASNFALSGVATMVSRSGIRCPGNLPVAPTAVTFGCDANTNMVFNEDSDAMSRACNYLSWADAAAYADWAGLRPLTELEFEKACRGTNQAVTGEYAWGSTTLEPATSALTNLNTAAESPNQGNCNYSICSPDGPYRCGSYADATSSRTNAGAGYSGVLDLSGSLFERTVSVATGRSFTGLSGDGTLDANGNANASLWPAGATGFGIRGGSWAEVGTFARSADRSYAAFPYQNRAYDAGGRSVRSAPAGVGP